MPVDSACRKIVEIDGRHPINSVVFLQDETQIVGGGDEGTLRYWEIETGREVRSEACEGEILTIAVSKDGKYIVTGTKNGLVTIWNSTAQKKAVELKAHSYWVVAVDVAPDSKAFGTASYDGAASIWDIITGQLLLGPLQPRSGPLVALKFSTSGSRVAVSPYAQNSIRIHDARDGNLLVDLPLRLSSNGNEPTIPLVWSSDDRQIFAVSHDGNINSFDTSSGAPLSQWPIHSKCHPASIVLSNNGKFIAASSGESISFWDTSNYLQLGPVVTHAGSVQSIALSSDDSHLASGGRTGKKVKVWNLRDVLPESYCHAPASVRVDQSEMALMDISRQACGLCIKEDWKEAETVITEEMERSSCTHYDSLANRALVRARLKDWQGAFDDARKSVEMKSSVIGYIAKAIARAGQGEHNEGIRTFDLTFMHCRVEDIPFLFLIRTIILFQVGEKDDAMKRVQDLIDTVDDKVIFYAVQAHMSLLSGSKLMEEDDYESAIKLFKNVQPQSISLSLPNPHLKAISLIFGWKFGGLVLSVRRQLCEALHATGRMKEAAEALLQTVSVLGESIRSNELAANWIDEFSRRCIAAFESMGDAATHLQAHDEAIEQYSIALSLNPPAAKCLYLKRSKARAIKSLWEDAVSDANEAIKLDPACPWGYERKRAALHGAQRFDEAIDAFASMLSTIENSSDQAIRQRRSDYVSPSVTTAAIDAVIHGTFDVCPYVLIDIKTGLLCDGLERTRIFKAEPAFKELVSSMTQDLDENRIRKVVTGYFRYAMFSHLWQGDEPSFQMVNLVKSVWVLPSSPLNDKLRKFCEVVRDDGYRWAWSDTCCINKSTSAMLNQSLISMYQWYEEAGITLALLVDVPTPSLPGDLTNSGWMSRAWTLLELLASKAIRFYDCQWKPYLNDPLSNHKESPGIVQELADTLGIDPGIITDFHPGTLTAREVLRLASTRTATIKEDVAYSLIGLLASDITPNYGEGEAALGHLLEEVLTRSGEIDILAWTGESSGFNTCIPASTLVYHRSPFMTSAVTEDEVQTRVEMLRATLSQQEAMTIYDRITRLPPVIGAHRRLHLPCIVFPVKKLRRHQGNRYYAKTSVLGEVVFQTMDDISLTDPRKLCFVHPWIQDLVGRTEIRSGVTWEDDSETDDTYDSDFNASEDIDSTVVSDTSTPPLIVSPEADMDMIQYGLSPLPSPLSLSSLSVRADDYTRALRVVARVEQTFSALLLQQTLNGKFRRVAAEHDILVRPCQVACARDVQTAVLEVL